MKKEDKKLIGKVLTTKSKIEFIQGELVNLETNDKHEVLDESEAAVKTNKSKDLWISKSVFKSLN